MSIFPDFPRQAPFILNHTLRQVSETVDMKLVLTEPTLHYTIRARVRKALHCLLLLLVFFITGGFERLWAAPTVVITGRVASATDDTPLAGTTVRLITLLDSSFIAGNFADREGNFSISSPRLNALLSPRKAHQRVMLQFTYVGFQETRKAFTLRHRQKQVALGDVYMQEEHRLLGEAVVSATPPPMVIREDTIEYYTSSYQLPPDATAEDLLRRLAGVEVQSDGTITAQGENVTRVYVDGKEFFGTNMQATTKNLTADMFESVQVVDMKTEESRLTGIDNGEREKVINLKLKPKMRRGMFGNAAGAWGDGSGIDTRYETKGMLGYFRGNSQHALIANANNTNDTGFGDLGEKVMRGSTMRGNRNNGQRGSGLNTSWSTGLNLNYDRGNRLKDDDTPLAIGGDILYGGERQSEDTRSHRINYLSSGNTGTDSQQSGTNHGHNFQFDLKYEQTWGNKKDGEHRLQVKPEMAYNRTRTDEQSESQNYYLTSNADDVMTAAPAAYISQTQRTSNIEQDGVTYGMSATYSYTRQTSRGRRRSSVTASFNHRHSDGDHFTQSFTSYDTDLVSDLSLRHDTAIHQWQEERSRAFSYRLRLTHVEPITKHQFVELSATGNFSRNTQQQFYHFWDDMSDQYVDAIGETNNQDYNSDSRTLQNSNTLSGSYRRVTERSNTSIGLDVLPSSQRYTDYYDHTRDYSRHYVNYSPRIEYRYKWSRRNNLRITLSGQTSQPSMNQLQARKNQTSATHVTLGNKDLRPAYQTRFNARYRKNNPESGNTLEASITASATFNTLASKRWYSSDLRIDTTMTVNIDGLGAWNVQGDFRGSFPFADNHWYVSVQSSLAYRESVGYANLRSTDTRINHARNLSADQHAGIAYRNDWFNAELRSNYHIGHTSATVVTSANLGTTHQLGISSHLSARLPWNLGISTDIRYIGRRGYSAGVTRNQTIWNAQLSRSFLKRRNLSAFVKLFDILHQKSSLYRSISATSITDRETTTLRQYFLVGCSVKFNQRPAKGGDKDGENKQKKGKRN